MAKLEWEIVEDKTWESVVKYLDARMKKNRQSGGKYGIGNEELWRLKKAMSEVDPAIESVGRTFVEHEEDGHDVKGRES